MEGILPLTMKMSLNGKHGKWNQTKKNQASLSLWKNCGKQLMFRKNKNE
jgi:hypothetical protein